MKNVQLLMGVAHGKEASKFIRHLQIRRLFHRARPSVLLGLLISLLSLLLLF